MSGSIGPLQVWPIMHICLVGNNRARVQEQSQRPRRHCEERSDEAIQLLLAARKLDCFVASLLAMTG